MIKRLICLAGGIFICLFGSGCQAVEPEEVYLVSALGFDFTTAGIRVTAEVPLTRETETDRMEVRVFEGEGQSFQAALDKMKDGLAKKLEFGHCALVVIGAGVEEDVLKSILSELTNLQVPLSVTMICSPDAKNLLQQGSLSAPAAGYEIPDILRLIAAERGITFRCRLYEIDSANGNFELPRFLPSGAEVAAVDCYDGLCKFQSGKMVIS